MSSIASAREPQCPKCGYILLGLSEHRCPECGTEFDADFVETFAKRSRLLAWERRELGGVTRRLLRTMFSSLVRPGAYHHNLQGRASVRVAHRGRFIAACSLAWILTAFCAMVAEGVAFFVRLVFAMDYAPAVALRSVVESAPMTFGTDVALVGYPLVWNGVGVIVLGCLFTVFSRSDGIALGVTDWFSVLAPLVPLAAIAGAPAKLVASNLTITVTAGDSFPLVPVLLMAVNWLAGFGLMVLHVWCFGRHFKGWGVGRSLLLLGLVAALVSGALWLVAFLSKVVLG